MHGTPQYAPDAALQRREVQALATADLVIRDRVALKLNADGLREAAQRVRQAEKLDRREVAVAALERLLDTDHGAVTGEAPGRIAALPIFQPGTPEYEAEHEFDPPLAAAPLRLLEILLPLYGNNGQDLGDRHVQFRDWLLVAWGGFTQCPVVTGAWQDAGKVYKDTLIPYRVAVTADKRDVILRKAHILFDDQEALFLADLGEAFIAKRP